MITAKEMDEMSINLGFSYGGKSALKHFEIVERLLQPNEDVLLTLTTNSITNGSKYVTGGITAVVFTTHRFICAQKASKNKEPVKVVNLDIVNDIHKNPSGLLEGTICIDTPKETIGIHLQKVQLDRAFAAILETLDTYKQKDKPSTSHLSSTADEILKFKELLDLGIITQDEFTIKKKQLLDL